MLMNLSLYFISGRTFRSWITDIYNSHYNGLSKDHYHLFELTGLWISRAWIKLTATVFRSAYVRIFFIFEFIQSKWLWHHMIGETTQMSATSLNYKQIQPNYIWRGRRIGDLWPKLGSLSKKYNTRFNGPPPT